MPRTVRLALVSLVTASLLLSIPGPRLWAAAGKATAGPSASSAPLAAPTAYKVPSLPQVLPARGAALPATAPAAPALAVDQAVVLESSGRDESAEGPDASAVFDHAAAKAGTVVEPPQRPSLPVTNPGIGPFELIGGYRPRQLKIGSLKAPAQLGGSGSDWSQGAAESFPIPFSYRLAAAVLDPKIERRAVFLAVGALLGLGAFLLQDPLLLCALAVMLVALRVLHDTHKRGFWRPAAIAPKQEALLHRIYERLTSAEQQSLTAALRAERKLNRLRRPKFAHPILAMASIVWLPRQIAWETAWPLIKHKATPAEIAALIEPRLPEFPLTPAERAVLADLGPQARRVLYAATTGSAGTEAVAAEILARSLSRDPSGLDETEAALLEGLFRSRGLAEGLAALARARKQGLLTKMAVQTLDIPTATREQLFARARVALSSIGHGPAEAARREEIESTMAALKADLPADQAALAAGRLERLLASDARRD